MQRGSNRRDEPDSAWAECTNDSHIEETSDEALHRQRSVAPEAGLEFTDEMMADAEWVMPAKKVPVCLRMEPDVLEYFRSQGPGYQCRMNAVLRSYVTRARERDGAAH